MVQKSREFLNGQYRSFCFHEFGLIGRMKMLVGGADVIFSRSVY